MELKAWAPCAYRLSELHSTFWSNLDKLVKEIEYKLCNIEINCRNVRTNNLQGIQKVAIYIVICTGATSETINKL